MRFVVFAEAGKQPFPMWTDLHIRQGFAWRPQSVLWGVSIKHLAANAQQMPRSEWLEDGEVRITLVGMVLSALGLLIVIPWR
jgi:hypothetical protein